LIQALVLTHGAIGKELVRVVALILGPTEGLSAETNQGRSAREVAEVVRAWVEGLDADDRGVILIDDYGGSCASAARLGGAEAGAIPVISGVNLTMLLALVTWREEIQLDELVQRVVDQARQAVKLVGGGR
jgi:mannose/fructose-specific phosphotransferase system component IIA